jgi:hypothetical protein
VETNTLPVACSLTDAEFRERRNTVLQKFRSGVVEVTELDSGYAYHLPANGEWLTELAALVSFERQCCPFLRFSITAEPGNGPIRLEMTGPRGTKEFLAATFSQG